MFFQIPIVELIPAACEATLKHGTKPVGIVQLFFLLFVNSWQIC